MRGRDFQLWSKSWEWKLQHREYSQRYSDSTVRWQATATPIVSTASCKSDVLSANETDGIDVTHVSDHLNAIYLRSPRARHKLYNPPIFKINHFKEWSPWNKMNKEIMLGQFRISEPRASWYWHWVTVFYTPAFGVLHREQGHCTHQLSTAAQKLVSLKQWLRIPRDRGAWVA